MDSDSLLSPPHKYIQCLQERPKGGFAAETILPNAVAPQFSAMDIFVVDKGGRDEITQEVLDASLALLDMRCGHKRVISCPRPKVEPRFLLTTNVPYFRL